MSDTRPPIIGLTCSEIQPVQEGSSVRFGQSQTYVQALAKAGAAPLLVPPIADRSLLRSLYERLDGLLLAGGRDIDPTYYGETLHEKCIPDLAARDEMELVLTRWAVDEGKPLLGICRGIQVLNVALGGSLYQDIDAQVPGAERHAWHDGYPRDHLPHQVTVAAGTHLASIVGTAHLPVNSLHHQAIKDVALGLAAVARASDGIIEAAEVEGHPFALAVQWHPEELIENDVRARQLFAALIEACQRRKVKRDA